MDILELLNLTIEQKGSDLHISSGEAPAVRVDGSIRKVTSPPLSKEETREILYDIMTDAHRRKFEEQKDLDMAIQVNEGARFRVNIFNHHRGMGAVFRQIPTEIMTLEQLGMDDVLKDICRSEKGMVLVTGPTGSGKSTTLAAMIDFLNDTYDGHILTIEDPIEFVHKSKNCLINQREIETHTRSFATALRAALREDPDIILVGEMRDPETIELALTAAETGHLVFGTLHTQSAPKTMDRIIDSFPAGQQAQVRAMISDSIKAVISQVLCKKVGGGRIAANEILIGTTAVSNLIRENKIHQLKGVMQSNRGRGMRTMDMSLAEYVKQGKITENEAIIKSGNPAIMETN